MNNVLTARVAALKHAFLGPAPAWMGTTVNNLRTGKPLEYTQPPRLAVICAYAQERGDYNTWEYEARYGALVKLHGSTWHLGDWAATEPKKEGE